MKSPCVPKECSFGSRGIAGTDVYSACYPLSLVRNESLSGNSDFDNASGLSRHNQRRSSFGSTTSSHGSLSGSTGPMEEDNFSYEEECAPGLKDFLTNHLEKQIVNLAETALTEKPLGEGRTERSRRGSLTLSGLRGTLQNAVSEILRLSEDEPYGIRGALILLKLKNPKGAENFLGSIAMDESTVSTFKLVLVLQEETKLSASISNWFGQLTGSGSPKHLISSQYFLSKLKLYRSNKN